MSLAGTAFATRLARLTGVGVEEADALLRLAAPPETIGRERAVVSEGDTPRAVHVVVDGWAARVKWTPHGKRLISALLMPGDLCDIDGLHVRAYDYGVQTLTACTIVGIDRRALLALCDAAPAVARALAWFGFVDNALLNEAAASLAHRSARQRLAHLLCELRLRLAALGPVRPDGYDLPVSQNQIGDALGLTPVHINRMIRELREEGLARVTRHQVRVPDWDALGREAAFSPDYLHLDGMRVG